MLAAEPLESDVLADEPPRLSFPQEKVVACELFEEFDEEDAREEGACVVGGALLTSADAGV